MNLRVIAITGTVALASSLLLARAHPFGDAGLYTPAQAQTQSSVPAPAAAVFTAKCMDCHSDAPHPPFYGHFAPVSWLLERDIVEARKELNFSKWDSYTPEEQQVLQAKIIQETKSNRMPLPQYRAIHWNSAITPSDLSVLNEWVRPADLTASPSTQSEGNAAAGKIVFEKRCTGCHSLDQNREGPNLRGVFGRATGTAPGFPYSPALKNAHVTWNELTLEKWLTDPDVFLPGNNMDFRVAKPQERSDLIRFLKQTTVP